MGLFDYSFNPGGGVLGQLHGMVRRGETVPGLMESGSWLINALGRNAQGAIDRARGPDSFNDRFGNLPMPIMQPQPQPPMNVTGVPMPADNAGMSQFPDSGPTLDQRAYGMPAAQPGPMMSPSVIAAPTQQPQPLSQSPFARRSNPIGDFLMDVGTMGQSSRNAEIERVLISQGKLSPDVARIVAQDPGMVRSLLPQMMGLKNATFGKVGVDADGKDVMGWIDASSQTVTPVPMNGAMGGGAGFNQTTFRQELGKEAAKTAAADVSKQRLSPQVTEGLRSLSSLTQRYDNPSFANALGPIQGSEPDGLLSGAVINTARLFGEAANQWEGGKHSPSEVRSNIKGSTEALAAAIKPLIRAPGEGVWTDSDQARLVAVVGDLANSRDKFEFKRRLNQVKERLEANFGLKLDFDANQPSGGAPPIGGNIPPPPPGFR